MTSLQGKTVLITGAASGTSFETAVERARRGGELRICDFDEAGLQAARERFE